MNITISRINAPDTKIKKIKMQTILNLEIFLRKLKNL